MSNTTTLQTRDQKYAASAYIFVKKLYDEEVNKNPDVSVEPKKSSRLKRYGSMAHKLPVLIRTAGLAQALAFVEARDKSSGEHRLLLDHVARTIFSDPQLGDWKHDEAKNKLLTDSRTVDLATYMHRSQQVLDALLWYKRFAQSVLNVEPTDDDDDKSE